MNLSLIEVRSKLADTINRVAYQGQRVVLRRHGKSMAALVSMDDLALLEKLEEKIDVREAKKALAEMKRNNAQPIPLHQVKKKLGL